MTDTTTFSGWQRYRGVLHGEKTDFLPRTPILMQYAAEYIGSDYGQFAADYRVLVQANAACARDFGMDQVSCISDSYRETHGFGADVEFVTDGPPHGTHPLADSKDLTRLAKPNPYQSERMLDRVKAAEAFSKQFSGTYSILGWVEGPAAEAADLRNVIPFLMDVIDDPEFACDLMDLCVDVGIAFAEAQIEAGADTIGIGDAIASQMSPDVYETMIQPREKRLVKAIKDAGAFVKLHICGNITHLLPGIADLGIDILDVDHMVDMATVRAVVGDRVTLTGNIDPVAGVARGTPERIRQELQRLYDTVGNPFMINAGCEIPSGTPPENLRALCEPIPGHD